MSPLSRYRAAGIGLIITLLVGSILVGFGPGIGLGVLAVGAIQQVWAGRGEVREPLMQLVGAVLVATPAGLAALALGWGREFRIVGTDWGGAAAVLLVALASIAALAGRVLSDPEVMAVLESRHGFGRFRPLRHYLRLGLEVVLAVAAGAYALNLVFGLSPSNRRLVWIAVGAVLAAAVVVSPIVLAVRTARRRTDPPRLERRG